MQDFYRQTLLGCAALLAGSLLLAWFCVERSDLTTALLPARQGALPWHARGDTDPGTSTIAIHETGARLRFRLRVMPGPAYPFAAVNLFFEDRHGKPVHVNLARYDTLSLRVRCAPANTLQVNVPTFDDKVSTPGSLLSYRTPTAFIACDQAGGSVDIDLTRLETPQWWFDMFKLDLSRQAYTLDRVPRISIGSTFQSPRAVAADVDIGEMILHGRDVRFLYFLAAALMIAWALFGFWFFRRHSAALVADVREKLQKDLPFVAYQQLSLEPHRDKEKAAVLRYIAAHYAEAELDVEGVVQATGVNRNKLNDILKAELGFTFSGYLNKLRLTEAARLLADRDAATVAEIAYSVGYANVSYFNKLFKEEYGCTPRAFRAACDAPGA